MRDLYKAFRTFLGIGTLVLTLSGCGHNETEILRGYPLAVDMDPGKIFDKRRLVMKIAEYESGEHIKCYTSEHFPYDRITEAKVSIEAERCGGDSNLVELIGKYKGNVFEISRVIADGDTIPEL